MLIHTASVRAPVNISRARNFDLCQLLTIKVIISLSLISPISNVSCLYNTQKSKGCMLLRKTLSNLTEHF